MVCRIRQEHMKNLIIAFSFLTILFSVTFAQPKDMRTIREDKKSDGYVGVALVIGNSAYKHATPLNSPVNDAGDMAKTFANLGFKVLSVRANAGFSEMDNAIAEFGRELEKNGGVGVFYYSGHGVQSNGKNYLIPIDANIPLESFLSSRSVDADIVLRTMANATKGFKVVILDACRNNPFAKSWGYKGDTGSGLAGIYSAPKGTLIAYATSPNDTAADGNGRNSPYTEVLLQEMIKPNVKIGEMFDNVREILDTQTKGDQTPWESTSLIGKFCFAGCNVENTANQPIPTPRPMPVADNNRVESPNNSTTQTNPITNSNGNENLTYSNSLSEEQLRNPKAGMNLKLPIGKGVEMEFVGIPSGTFVMGSGDAERKELMRVVKSFIPNPSGMFDDEKSQRKVSFRNGFWFGKYEITQEEFFAVMGSYWRNSDNCIRCPVVEISWNQAKNFIEKLNSKSENFIFRLPSEAEWEYAARAGTTTPFGIGDGVNLSSNEANFDGGIPYGNAPKGNRLDKVSQVGIFKPNRWGLYDMHGNVSEWCEDFYWENYKKLPLDGSPNLSLGDSGKRVERGGYYGFPSWHIRSATRLGGDTESTYVGSGFRIAVRLK
jgi:formylglycine-generating enzyme required for sulfatase activity